MESLPQPGKFKKVCNFSRKLLYICKKIQLHVLFVPSFCVKNKFISLFHLVFSRNPLISIHKCLFVLFTPAEYLSPISTTTIDLSSPLYIDISIISNPLLSTKAYTYANNKYIKMCDIEIVLKKHMSQSSVKLES